ncbi:hypothetical protein NONO_c46160 [Nocardia nova SH22a]|uniref:Uncharacterized protein n=1 Tax=Nocardia nova SH22a TaxID=1415166 RepID=W5TJB3_9NOCA|nr:hypothetical protein NONO_c46160 [Nocardia nova SH22a]
MQKSYLLYDFLLPYLGEQAATYWSQLFVVGPL